MTEKTKKWSDEAVQTLLAAEFVCTDYALLDSNGKRETIRYQVQSEPLGQFRKDKKR